MSRFFSRHIDGYLKVDFSAIRFLGSSMDGIWMGFAVDNTFAAAWTRPSPGRGSHQSIRLVLAFTLRALRRSRCRDSGHNPDVWELGGRTWLIRQ